MCANVYIFFFGRAITASYTLLKLCFATQKNHLASFRSATACVLSKCGNVYPNTHVRLGARTCETAGLWAASESMQRCYENVNAHVNQKC